MEKPQSPFESLTFAHFNREGSDWFCQCETPPKVLFEVITRREITTTDQKAYSEESVTRFGDPNSSKKILVTIVLPDVRITEPKTALGGFLFHLREAFACMFINSR